MSRLTAQQAQQKQAQRLKNASQDIKDGINRVTEAPGQKAAKKQEKMLQNITEAITSGKWARNTAKVSVEDWKKAAIEKGVPRISAGIDAAAPKTIAFFEQLFPFQDNLKQKVDAMPDLTLDDNIQRAATWMRGMAGFKKQ